MYSPVPELNELYELQTRLGGHFISDGFELFEFGEAQHDGWSEAQEFMDAFIPFAYATGSGSVYALWRVDDGADLASLPIAVFGDEGGIWLIARNLRDLLRQLACDRPVWVDWDGAYFSEYAGYHREREGAAEAQAAYVEWLSRNLGLGPADDPNELVDAVQSEHGERFAAWLEPFVGTRSVLE